MHSSMQNSTRPPELQTADKRRKRGSALGASPVFIYRMGDTQKQEKSE